VNKSNRTRSATDESAIRNYPRLLKRYARLLEVSSELVSTLDQETLLQHIAEVARELTTSEASSILLYDSQTNHLYFEAATGPLKEGFSRSIVPTDNSIAGWIYSNQEPLLVEDTKSDSRFFADIDLQTDFLTRSILGVPLQTKDKTIGVIEVLNKEQGTFTEDDQLILRSLAAQAAIAIENTRLFQQSDLIAEMVHELRTPLAALLAAAHLLQRPDLAREQSGKLSKTIFGEVQRLNEMTTDFLELARLESGRAKFEREPVHLEGLVVECLELVRPQADERKVTLKTDFERNLNPVHGDRNRLKQVVLNLLTNAIKYNHENGQVMLSLQRDKDSLVFSVEDTGYGIPAKSLPHIFERFYRVPDQENDVKGTGLGLVIAKRIARNHNGDIEVESQLGKGSIFRLQLPIPRGTAAS